ncbi:hypothetical protein HP439_13040 [Sphingobacterium shayense]|uniref:hypothetical protein n=1 Tax=Sphingobacterium shayense TaxID=626343 RepID=UPI00155235DC|nr:hypothetical protein [Sphingobacterium shayense]NQD71648.1 hypothetical protein [Sphingobacterium shayense]
MNELLKEFPYATKRSYKGGIEVRVKDLDAALIKARRLIEEKKLEIEVFAVHSTLRSFAVRKKAS